jgi:hypothetical protein
MMRLKCFPIKLAAVSCSIFVGFSRDGNRTLLNRVAELQFIALMTKVLRIIARLERG